MRMHRFNQSRHMFGWCELTDAVPKVKDMGGPAGAGIGMGLPKTVEHTPRFSAQRLLRCK